MNQLFSSFFAAGDAPFFFEEAIRSFPWMPDTWNSWHGLGMQVLFRLWYDYPFQLITKLFLSLGISWWVVDKLLWIGTFILSGLSMYLLSRHVIKQRVWQSVSAALYATNTYALMLFGGGQFGVYLGYALLPLLLAVWIIDPPAFTRKRWKEYVKWIIKVGLITSMLVAADLRIGAIGGGILALFFIWELLFVKKSILERRTYIQRIGTMIVCVGFITVLLHLYWLLPTITSRGAFSNVGEEITGVGMVEYLSFADFSHTLSLLHPNWPENLFGYIHFMRPEFLIIPILAFVSLGITSDVSILFFLFLGLVGAFLAKGTHDPGGEVYAWLFTHVPGFVLFRDPTKFYSLVAISYALALPFSCIAIGKKIIQKGKQNVKPVTIIILSILLLLWAFLDREALMGKLTGNFSPPTLPNDFILYKNMLINDPTFSRVLWVPEYDRFVFGSNIHPFVDADSIIKNSSPSSLIATATSAAFLSQARRKGINYIAIATDEAKKLYINDYKYDSSIRGMYINAFERTELPRVPGFATLHMYEIGSSSALLSDSAGIPYDYTMENSALYRLSLTHDSTVNFLMNYDPNWRLVSGGTRIAPIKTEDGFMSFVIPINVLGSVALRYIPQMYANTGAILSGISLILVLIVFAFL